MRRLNKIVKLRLMHREAEIVGRLDLFDTEQEDQRAERAKRLEIIAEIGMVKRHHGEIGRVLLDRHQRLLFRPQRLPCGRAEIEFLVFAAFKAIGVKAKFLFGARFRDGKAGVIDGPFAAPAGEQISRLIAKAELLAGKRDARAFLVMVLAEGVSMTTMIGGRSRVMAAMRSVRRPPD